MVNHDNVRIIKTSFYSQIAADVLRSCIGQLSDGWGENNPANDKWWKFADVQRATDGQVIIYVSTESNQHDYASRWVHNGFYGMTDVEVLAKFAHWVKKTMLMELKDNDIENGWKRNNTSTKTFYLSYNVDINVAQVYCIYETLLDRNIASGRYSSEILNAVFGHKASDEEIKKEEEKREAFNKVQDQYNENLKTIEENRNQAIKDLQMKIDEINKMYNEQCNQSNLRYKEAVDNLKKIYGRVA